jgi:Fe-S-cluster containining protein
MPSSGTYKVVKDEAFKLTGTCLPEKCKSWCCRHLVLHVKTMFKDDPDYFQYHGCSIRDVDDKSFWIITQKDCMHLSGNMCMAYEHRPRVCRRYAKMFSDMFWSPDCTLLWKKVIGREAQTIISKSKKGEVHESELTIYV